ncbi:MAG: RnfABCDGE type electron transport complex subunit D [Cyanobacteria bacterium P01_A01_bin.123]
MLRDARDYQILALGLFLVLGIALRDWSLRPEVVGVAIATCLLTQTVLTLAMHWQSVKRQALGDRGENLTSPSPYPPIPPSPPLSSPLKTLNWRSPLITALGLSLLLRVDHIPTMALAASLAIASKFFLKTHDKHFFNPANFGIIAVLLLTQDAWVSPGQWGEEVWYGLIFLGAGGVVLKRVGRWDTTVMFLATYAAMEAARNLWLGWTWDVWAHRMMSGSLLMFALFMVTDPRSIPNARPARLIWSSAIALLTFILRNYFYLSTAVFWALFLLAPLTIVLDKLWVEQRFFWRKPVAVQPPLLAGSQTAAVN